MIITKWIFDGNHEKKKQMMDTIQANNRNVIRKQDLPNRKHGDMKSSLKK
jgi:hypothetical protein